MKTHTKIVFFLLIGLTLSFCASTEKIQTQFPQEISSVYFQKWLGGREETGRGIYFYLEFKEPLSKEIQLEKIYFQGQEAKVNQETETNFVANFINDKNSKIRVTEKPKFDLAPNEAVLEYTIKNKKFFFKIENIKEKPMIAYPSMNKPKN